MHTGAAGRYWLEEERVNEVSYVLTSAFPRRCFGAVTFSSQVEVGNCPPAGSASDKGFKFRSVTRLISHSRLGVLSAALCLQRSVLWIQTKYSNAILYGRLSPFCGSAPLCATVSKWCPGTRINQLTINYVGQCVAVWEKLSVCRWIWLWLNWHCSSPLSEWGFAQRVLQHYCDCVWGRGRQEFALCDFSCKCSTAPTVRAYGAHWIPFLSNGVSF